ncbi:hypothetical protein Leryth_020932 [Lithospermum erythrorhizon]|nr:hypothetical protein Leryth_020932 [Lithospermum erythrorhizon]
MDKSDTKTGKPLYSKFDTARDLLKVEVEKTKGRDLESVVEKTSKSDDREERRSDSEWTRRGKSEMLMEDSRGASTREDRSSKEGMEEREQIRNPSGWDIVDSSGRTSNTDEDGAMLIKEKSRRDTEGPNRSKTPERSGRRHYESDNFDTDNDRANTFRRKEEKEIFRDDRIRDREVSKDTWRRRQSIGDRETKDGDVNYDHGREWELPRRGRDNDRPQGRFGFRKDGNRTEAVKTSSKYGISNENYDVIEIQTKPFDYGREESTSVVRTEAVQQSDALVTNRDEDAYAREDREKKAIGSGQSGDDSKKWSADDGSTQDLNWINDSESQGGKMRDQKHSSSSRSGSLPPQSNQEPSSFNRGIPQGSKGSRVGRGGRGRQAGRDSQPVGLPMPMMGSPFGPLGMPPPGSIQPLNPTMSPAPGPPMSPGVFMPPFSPPVVWPGARGVEMNMLGVPPGPAGSRYPPSVGTPPNPPMYFNQPGPGRGFPQNISGPNFNAIIPVGRGQMLDKTPGGWDPPRTSLPPGKAPSRGEQNDYSQNFVDTGMRPQNFIRELELTSVVEDYPKLRELIQRKDEIVAKAATPPMYLKCDLREQVLSPELFGTKFDVILIDPPWEEYVHRAPGVTDHMEYWTFEEIMNLKIEAIADTPSFIFLWVGDGVGLEQGRQCLKKWGFRRCEDICWVKTNKTNATPGLRHDSHTLFQRIKEHCLMGIKGTVRRSTDGHIIHANIDTDVIIAEEPPYGSTAKPEDMYRIVEHFALGRRRLELFGEDHNIRTGWLTVGSGLSSSNFTSDAYIRNFSDKDGKVWQGGGGRNPPPEAPHLVQTTPDIEALRPKSPMKNQQQMQQQQSASISLTTATSSNKRTGNSPQNYNAPNLNQEASSSNMSTPGPWASPMDNFQGRDRGRMASEDRSFDMYGYNSPFMQANAEF